MRRRDHLVSTNNGAVADDAVHLNAILEQASIKPERRDGVVIIHPKP